MQHKSLKGRTGRESQEEFAEIVAVVVVHQVEAQEDEKVAAEGTPLNSELSAHFCVLHQFVVGLAEGKALSADVGVQHDVLGGPQGGVELDLQTQSDRIVEVVSIAEPVPNQQKFVSAGSVGVVELFVGADWGTGRHCEVGSRLQAPLLFIRLFLVFRRL
jgi:hypothetical protein